MARSKIRLILAAFVLLISVLLLVWGLWPLAHVSRVLPLPPGDLQLPTPGGFLPDLWPAA